MTISPDKRVYYSLHDDSQHWLSLMMGGTGLWSSVSMCGAEQCWVMPVTDWCCQCSHSNHQQSSILIETIETNEQNFIFLKSTKEMKKLEDEKIFYDKI